MTLGSPILRGDLFYAYLIIGHLNNYLLIKNLSNDYIAFLSFDYLINEQIK